MGSPNRHLAGLLSDDRELNRTVQLNRRIYPTTDLARSEAREISAVEPIVKPAGRAAELAAQ